MLLLSTRITSNTYISINAPFLESGTYGMRTTQIPITNVHLYTPVYFKQGRRNLCTTTIHT